MSSLRDTTADDAAALHAQRTQSDGSVVLEPEQARDARSAICDALSSFDAMDRIVTRQHDRNILRGRRARLKYVLTMLGPD